MDEQSISIFLAYCAVILLCLSGLLLSCISFSGTWFILVATGILTWTQRPNFPRISVFIVFLALCIITEILETIASAWGVQKRGGTKSTGWAAIGGGLLGTLLGGAIMPIFGNLLGMLIGSFGVAFWIEYAQMKKFKNAAHIAFGAVLARLSVIFIKLGVTIIMLAVLTIGLMRSHS